MIWIVFGLALWAGSHFFKRAAPQARAGMGNAGKGLVAAASLVGIVLMVIGYQMADGAVLWVLSPWARHVNNLLMVIAVFLFALSHARSRLRPKIRHPMLISVVVWAVAHLLVNGDVRALVLFGGLAVWALAEIAVINRAQPHWTPRPTTGLRGDLIWIGISVVTFLVVVLLHGWLGPWPLG